MISPLSSLLFTPVSTFSTYAAMSLYQRLIFQYYLTESFSILSPSYLGNFPFAYFVYLVFILYFAKGQLTHI